MTSIIRLSLALAAVALAAGCASDPQPVSGDAKAPLEYRTGSNIPVRGSRPTTEAERARAQADLEELRRAGGLGQPGR
jgi:type IV pilus biogenesis protein CpaD/CtpE